MASQPSAGRVHWTLPQCRVHHCSRPHGPQRCWSGTRRSYVGHTPATTTLRHPRNYRLFISSLTRLRRSSSDYSTDAARSLLRSGAGSRYESKGGCYPRDRHPNEPLQTTCIPKSKISLICSDVGHYFIQVLDSSQNFQTLYNLHCHLKVTITFTLRHNLASPIWHQCKFSSVLLTVLAGWQWWLCDVLLFRVPQKVFYMLFCILYCAFI